MRIAIILGTRPEIIKLAPVIFECERRGVPYGVIHTGQHYDFLMDKVFFQELGLKTEAINLNVGSGTHGEITGKTVIGLERVLVAEKPDVVVVQGDTTAVLAGTLVAAKLHIPIAHVEAGLRSYDRRMPEEYNRVIADHCADFLFAPTEQTFRTLHDEGVLRVPDILYYGRTGAPRVIQTGNTVVDVIERFHERLYDRAARDRLGIAGPYALITLHREENVDHPDRLQGIIEGLRRVQAATALTLVFPVHPRTKKKLAEFGFSDALRALPGLKLLEPLGFFELLSLEAGASLILTDSGGIQEEACTLRVPCVVIRDRSDRSESIAVGAATLAGTDPGRIAAAALDMLSRERSWQNPFGDGHAAARIVDALCASRS